jgi:hypothetical protein
MLRKKDIITKLYQKQLFSLAILSVKHHHSNDNFSNILAKRFLRYERIAVVENDIKCFHFMSFNLQFSNMLSMICEWLNNAKSIDVDGYREILGVFHVIRI